MESAKPAASGTHSEKIDARCEKSRAENAKATTAKRVETSVERRLLGAQLQAVAVNSQSVSLDAAEILQEFEDRGRSRERETFQTFEERGRGMRNLDKLRAELLNDTLAVAVANAVEENCSQRNGDSPDSLEACDRWQERWS